MTAFTLCRGSPGNPGQAGVLKTIPEGLLKTGPEGPVF